MKKLLYATMLVLVCALLSGCGARMSVTVTKKGVIDDKNASTEYLLTKEELDSLKEQMPDYIAKLSKTTPVNYDGVAYYAADSEEFSEEYAKVLEAQMGDIDAGEVDDDYWDDDDWDDDDWDDDDWDDDDWDDDDWDDDDWDDTDYDGVADEPSLAESEDPVDIDDFKVTKKKFVYKYVPDEDADDSDVMSPFILRVTMPKAIGKTNGKIDPSDPCTVEFNIDLTKKKTYKAKVAKKAK